MRRLLNDEGELEVGLNELCNAVYEVSNQEFPLSNFLNDVIRNKDEKYNKKQAFRDIAKIYETFMYFREKDLYSNEGYKLNPSSDLKCEYSNDKDIPMKPISERETSDIFGTQTYYYCPNCKLFIGVNIDGECRHCGKKLIGVMLNEKIDKACRLS